MTKRRSFALVAVTVFLVTFAMRTIPLYWSPLPFNTDGIHHAALAREIVETGRFPIAKGYFHSDEYAFSSLLAGTSQITGISPFYIAQVLTATISAATALFVVVVTRGVGRRLGWSRANVRVAMTVAGLVVATEGVFLGRSVAVTSEGVGHLFVIMGVFVLAYALWTDRPSWFVLTAIIFLLFPLTHNLSTIIGFLSCLSLLTLYLGTSMNRPSVLGGCLVLGFGGYSILYYGVTGTVEARLTTAPGLFVAWVIVLVLLTLWLPTTNPRLQYGVPSAILVGSIILIVVNYFQPVFPGTASTEVVTMLFILPVAIIGFIGARGVPFLTRSGVEGYATLGMLLGTLALIGFALTAGLTPDYQGLATRGQTYVHLPWFVLAGVGVVAFGLTRDSDRLKAAVLVLVLVSAVVSAPLAFSGLRATSAQPLVTPSELEAATFVSMHAEGWTSDGHMTRLASKYYPEQIGSSGSQLGVQEWLRGSGTEPRCGVVARQSWTTVGVQLYPASPGHITPVAYERFNARRNVVYSVGGSEEIVYSVSKSGPTERCR